MYSSFFYYFRSSYGVNTSTFYENNYNMSNFYTVFFLFYASIAFGQEFWPHSKTIQLSSRNKIFTYLDTSTTDTIIENYLTYYRTIKTKENIEISKGSIYQGFDAPCGCKPKPNGHWIKRYRNGSLFSIGEYYCNMKLGTWVYFYENGNINKIENYSFPYHDFTADNLYFDFTYSRKPEISGLYVEYFESGNIKIEGHYKIYEIFANKDTTSIYNPDTFEEELHIIEGEYWIPKSYKDGYWKYYNKDGSIMKVEHYDMENWKDEKIRPIINRQVNEIINNRKKIRRTLD